MIFWGKRNITQENKELFRNKFIDPMKIDNATNKKGLKFVEID